jgi:hypothetical protein
MIGNVTFWLENVNSYWILSGKVEARISLGNLGIVGRIIVRWTLENKNGR